MTVSASVAPLPHASDAHGIVTITLEANQGPMTILDETLIRRIEATVRLVPRTASGVVLASGSPRVFVAGADLKSISGMDHHGLDAYLAFGQRVFLMFCELHCPTVAAINGAALGGGLELAMHCDGLVASPPPSKDGQPGRPYPIGLPEAGLSICPGWGGTNLLPARMDPQDAMRRTATGKTMLLEEAVSAGLIDRLAPSPEALLDTAKAWLVENRNIHADRRDGLPLRWIGRPNLKAKSLQAYAETKGEFPGDPGAACLRAVWAGLDVGYHAALDVERAELNRLRAAPAGAAAIRSFLDKSAAPKK